MNKKISILSNKTLTIYTTIVMILSMIIFEIGYCNSEWLRNLVLGTNINYHFSLCRIVIYIAFIILYFIFKKRFIEEALEVAKNKYKSVFIYLAVAAAIICIMIGIILCNIKLAYIRAASIGMITALLGSLFVIYVSNNIVKNVIITTCTLGIVFTFTTSYNHAIDEKKHFMTALNLSFLNFDYANNPITDKQIEQLPQISKFDTIDKFFDKYTPEITNEVNMEDVPSTPATYNFVTYIFPALGITIARFLGGSIIDLYIMGRIMNLLLYTILICIAIKILPYKKNIFMVVAMIPYMLLLASSYSIDGFCIGIIFIFIAYCLKLYKKNDAITLKQFAILAGLFLLVLLAKSMAYICVGAIIFILPLLKTIKKNKKYIPIMIIVAILLIALAVMAMLYVKNSGSEGDTRASGEVSVTKQLNILLTNPIHDIKLLIEHTKDTLLNFNWYEMLHYNIFFTPNAKCVMLLLMIFILYVSLTESDYIFKMKDKIIFIITFLLVWGMTSVVLYLTFTQVGALYVAGYQTRYIVPVLPLILMSIANNRVISKQMINRNMNITIISAMFILIGIAQLIVV